MPFSPDTDTIKNYSLTFHHRITPDNVDDDLDKNSANAYANPSDQKHPYVSPVYCNFSNGFPPT